MTRSGFVAMIVGSGLALGQLAALPAAADDMAERWQVLEPVFPQLSPKWCRANPGDPHGLRLQRLHAEYRAAGIHKSRRALALERLCRGLCRLPWARGLPNCRGLGAVNAVEIGRDVLAVARYLQGQPYVKASQISAVGWSLGGGAVLAALGQLTAAEKNSPLRAVVAYYPYCRDLQPWRAKVPALSLMGAHDEVPPPKSPKLHSKSCR
jgi:hypothetical protein